jgi:hypothetical protein
VVLLRGYSTASTDVACWCGYLLQRKWDRLIFQLWSKSFPFFEFFLFRNRQWIPPSLKWTHQLGIGTCWVQRARNTNWPVVVDNSYWC